MVAQTNEYNESDWSVWIKMVNWILQCVNYMLKSSKSDTKRKDEQW